MTRSRQLVTAAAAIAVLASLSWGQVRQIQLGGAMDANPGVGTGGSNRPVQGFVPVNGNDIMTGNVSGLAYFHGRVGTTSPYQFQGNLGSNALASFARQSAGNPSGGTYTGGYSPYYLPSNTVSTAGGALYSAPIGSGFDSALIPRSSYSPSASTAQISAINGSVSGSQAINRAVPTYQLEAGTPGAILSNPLFVLRTTELPNKRPDLNQSLVTPTPAIRQGVDTPKPQNPDMVQGLVSAGKDQRIGAQDSEVKSLVSDTYLALSDELNKAKGAPGDDTRDVLINGSLTANVLDVDPLTGRPRQIAVLPSFTSRTPGAGTGASTPGTVNTPGAATQGARAPGLPGPKRLTDLTDAQLTAGSKVKPVHMAPALGSNNQISGFDLMMSRAEQNLKDGKFLDAAESYQSALALKPEDPLALIGRAHAEMGAGIYAAAEYDLKFVFTRKPQLVAIKYDVNSFIPSSRQEFLLQDFQKLTANKETAPMASFLYCYLCYQTNRASALQTELTAWAGRNTGDDWQVVAQRAWSGK